MKAASFFKLAIAIFALFSPATAVSQSPPSAGGRHEIFAGGELESYLRNLQVQGKTGIYPWSLRPFSPVETDKLVSRGPAGPWASRYDLGPREIRTFEAGVIEPTVSVRLNSTFPYGYNDGPVWAGKGITTSAQGGFYLRAGPLSLVVAPMIFRAENASFALQATGTACPPTCADGQFAGSVDRPQRFGNGAYQRLDPGQSTLRFDGFGVSTGITTANEWWGPSQQFPFLLGNNAPGFIHFFAGTERPVNVLIGRLHARVIYGRLDQSPYSPVTGSKYFTSTNEPGRIRFASGLLTVFQPRGLTGLEIGIGRFFHSAWPASGIPRSYLREPLQQLLKSRVTESDAQSNQLASVFARWVFPRSGLEVYSEYGREDHNYDFRDAVQEPDHDRAYSVGLRKTYHSDSAGFNALHFELMNYQLTTLARLGRGEGAIYIHSSLRQGHTNRGQLLGSALGVGSAAGSSLGWDHYSRSGRTSWAWERTVSQDAGTFYLNGVQNPHGSDVSHAIRLERVTFLRALDLTTGVTAIREFNRDFRGDAWNLNASVTARYLIK